MSIRDRGTMKWTSLMLPEHVQLLREYLHDEYYQVEKPLLDEQRIEELNEVICEAMEFHSKLHITHYQKGHYALLVGSIHYVDEINKKLHIETVQGHFVKVSLEDIVHIE